MTKSNQFKLIVVATVWLFAFLPSVIAQDAEGGVGEQTLKVLKLKFGIAIDKANRPIEELGEKYLEALGSVQEKFQQAGDLDPVLAVKVEIERFSKTGEAPGEVSGIGELARVQKIFLQQAEKAQLESERQVRATKLTYRKALAAAVKDLTARGEVEEAVRARNEIVKLGILTARLATWDRGMVLHLRFNHSEHGGHLPDASGEENHGTLKGGASLADPVGKRSSFLRLDGKGDYVQCAHHESLSLDKAATISLWIRPRELRNMRGLVCKYISSNSYTLRIAGDGGSARVGFGDYSFNNRSKSSPPIGKWTHLVVTLADQKMKFYFNGQLDREGSKQRERGLAQNTNPVRIGSDYDGRYFKGDIDELRIYRRALGAAEIADLYRAERD